MFVIVESPTEPETAGASAELQALGGPRPPPPPLDGPLPSKAYLAECALAESVQREYWTEGMYIAADRALHMNGYFFPFGGGPRPIDLQNALAEYDNMALAARLNEAQDSEDSTYIVHF